MIVTIYKDIKLEDGTILPNGTRITATAVVQTLKGGHVDIIPANPYAKAYTIGIDDIESLGIEVEYLTQKEKETVLQYEKIAAEAHRILNSI